MATVLPDPEVLRLDGVVKHEFDVNEECRRRGSSALAISTIRRTVAPLFKRLGEKNDGMGDIRVIAAEEAVKNVLHADETSRREVTVLECGGIALRTVNKVGESGASLEEWIDPENTLDNGIGMHFITEFADDISVTQHGDMVECWFFFDGDSDEQRFPRIVHEE